MFNAQEVVAARSGGGDGGVWGFVLIYDVIRQWQGRRTRLCTLSRPTHLLRLIHARFRGTYPRPHRATSIPTLDIRAGRDFGKIILRRSRMIDLLRRDVMNGSSSRYADDFRGFTGRVAADVGGRGVFNALLCVRVFGLAGCGPVFRFGDGVHDEAGECVWEV